MRRAVTLPGSPGLFLGVIAVVAFSFSFPATKLAVDHLDPWFVSNGRAAVAGVLAACVLVAGRAPWPTARQWRSLVIVAAGVVFGFPALTSLALVDGGAAHGAVVIALLPAATAAVAVVRQGERPSGRFWLAVLAGTATVVAFALVTGHGALNRADGFELAATALCAIGYAEGGMLSRSLGGARTVCWALVLSLPLSVPVALATAPASVPPTSSLVGFFYVSLVSMFLGFFAWYAGLARGGIARIAQVQLAQPLLTIWWSALILHEHMTPLILGAAVVVLAGVAASQRARITYTAPPPHLPEAAAEGANAAVG